MSRFDERALWLSRNVLVHEPSLRTWLARRPVTGLDVDDIIQETYAKLTLVEDVSAIENVRSYVFRTAYSIMASHLRRSQIVSISSHANMEEFQVLDEQPDAERTLIAKTELQQLGEIIARLPPRIRQVLILRRIDGLSQKQVAARLGVSVSTVEKHMHAALKRLSQAYATGGNDGARASNIQIDEQMSNARD